MSLHHDMQTLRLFADRRDEGEDVSEADAASAHEAWWRIADAQAEQESPDFTVYLLLSSVLKHLPQTPLSTVEQIAEDTCLDHRVFLCSECFAVEVVPYDPDDPGFSRAV